MCRSVLQNGAYIGCGTGELWDLFNRFTDSIIFLTWSLEDWSAVDASLLTLLSALSRWRIWEHPSVPRIRRLTLERVWAWFRKPVYTWMSYSWRNTSLSRAIAAGPCRGNKPLWDSWQRTKENNTHIRKIEAETMRVWEFRSKNLLWCVYECQLTKKSSLVAICLWVLVDKRYHWFRWLGAESMVISILMHVCIFRPHWIKKTEWTLFFGKAMYIAGLWVGIQSACDLVSQTSQLRILHSATTDNLSPFDSKIGCICQSIKINYNKHVYHQRQVRKPINSEVKWDKC